MKEDPKTKGYERAEREARGNKWNIEDMAEWKTDDFPVGAVIPESGNSRDYVTGGWRSDRPIRDDETCTQCLLCWIFCPDTAIDVEDEKVTTFNLDHCKGCGVCANECPVDAIKMVPEIECAKGEE